MLTKVDLLTENECEQVVDFIERLLKEKFDTATPVLPFSVRVETERWLRQLREKLLLPVARNVVGEQTAALAHKLNAVTQSCREYLLVGIQAAERTDADRQQLRAAVFNEKVSIAVIRDELALAEQGARGRVRPAFERHFVSRHADVQRRLSQALTTEMDLWKGNLARQARQYEHWMKEHLMAELAPLSDDAVPVASGIIEQAEHRFRRIVEAFRDRLNRNVSDATGVTVSQVAWEAVQSELATIPIDVGRTFMVHWDLLWWLLPMKLVGSVFRGHAQKQVSGEVEKNLRRLVSDWTRAVDAAITSLRVQAVEWVDAEVATLDRLLAKQSAESSDYIDALAKLERIGEGLPSPAFKQ
jgi:hypothetical protein